MALVGSQVPTVEAKVPADATAAQTRAAIAQATATMNQRIRHAALDCELATMFVYAVDKQAYQRFIIDLENDFTAGRDQWPKTHNEAYARVSTWKSVDGVKTGGTDAMAFVQTGEEDEEEGAALTTVAKKNKDHIKCRNCGEMGHYQNKCPHPVVVRTPVPAVPAPAPAAPAAAPGVQLNTVAGAPTTIPGVQLTTIGAVHIPAVHIPGVMEAVVMNTVGTEHRCQVLATKNGGQVVDAGMLLINNQANVDVFVNPALLHNIRAANRVLTINTTAGPTSTNLVGDFAGYGEVWYHPGGIANILSYSRVTSRFKIEYIRAIDEFHLTKPNGGVRVFRQIGGLYMSPVVEGTALVSTVAENKSSYSTADYSRAVLARKLQIAMGRPSTKALAQMLERKLLPNCSLTKQDLITAEHIFGPDIGSLKGKTVRRGPTPARPAAVPNLPLDALARYSKVELCADIMFVDSIPFLVTVSRHIKFGTTTKIRDRTGATLSKALQAALKIYGAGGFKVTVAHMDGEFEHLRVDLAIAGVYLNTASRGEHMGDIERYIRTLKERTRAMYNTLPFQRMPDRLVIEMVYAAVYWLNSFPGASGISDTMSPRKIVLRQGIDYHKHCQVEFGLYVQTHEEHDNSMVTRTTGAIALRPALFLQPHKRTGPESEPLDSSPDAAGRHSLGAQHERVGTHADFIPGPAQANHRQR
jgi:Eukaryotic translation initiation factor 3 subunit G